MPIRILPAHVASLIAAGEVVDRPASLVRELIDNAVDAAATTIEITTNDPKLRQIAIVDDGIGMGPDDLNLCLEHHATSKLPNDSIMEINHLGFRGEALAAISAVADINIVSRPKEQDVAFIVGARHGNRTIKLRPCAGGFGTRVVVTDLFMNHPARLKFLKSDRVEKAWVEEIVHQAALAHPHIKFILQTDRQRRVFQPTGFTARLNDILWHDTKNDFIPLEFESGGYKITGSIPLPSALTEKPGKQYFMVNGRVVSDRGMASVISSVYKSLIGHNQSPPAAIHIHVPSNEVDVNVHPQKSAVKFLRQAEVHAFIRSSIEQALAKAGLRTPSNTYELARKLANKADGIREGDPRRLPLGRFLGQVDNMWIVAETLDGIALIDQHAAHERVIMDRLQAAIASRQKSSVSVTPAIERHLSPNEIAVIEPCLQTFNDLGFKVELSERMALMKAYPEVLSGCVPSKLFEHMIDICIREASDGVVKEALWETIATAACKAAIKAGDNIDADRANTLLREIESTPNASQCNHGRPTMVFLKSTDIAKLFGR